MKNLMILILTTLMMMSCTQETSIIPTTDTSITLETRGAWCSKNLVGKNLVSEMGLGNASWKQLPNKEPQIISMLLDAGVTQEQLDGGVYFVIGGSTCPHATNSAVNLTLNGVKNIQYISLPEGAHTWEAEQMGGQAMPAFLTNFGMIVTSQTQNCISDAEAQEEDIKFARALNCTLKQGSYPLRQLGVNGAGYYGTDNGFWVARGSGATKKWGQRR